MSHDEDVEVTQEQWDALQDVLILNSKKLAIIKKILKATAEELKRYSDI
jgi:hypothetical protein